MYVYMCRYIVQYKASICVVEKQNTLRRARGRARTDSFRL